MDNPRQALLAVGRAAYRCYQGLPGSRCEMADGYWLALSGLPAAELNVAGVLAGGGAGAGLDKVRAGFEESGVEGVVLLEAADGTAADGFRIVGRAAVMSRPATPLPPADEAGAALHRITGAQGLGAAVHLMASVAGVDPAALATVFTPASMRAADAELWGVTRDGHLGGVGITFEVPGAIAVFGIAVPRAQRGHGVSGALLDGIIASHVARLGCPGFVTATPDPGLYETRGFRTVACPTVARTDTTTGHKDHV